MRLLTLALTATVALPLAASAQENSNSCSQMIEQVDLRLPDPNEMEEAKKTYGMSEAQLKAARDTLDAARMLEDSDVSGCLTIVNAAKTLADRGLAAKAVANEDQAADEPMAIVNLSVWDYEPLYAQTWRVQQLMDRPAYSEQGEEVGEVEDILMSPDGKLTGIIVEGGGILDIGDRHVRVGWDELEFREDGNGVTVPLKPDNMTDFSFFDGEDSGPDLKETTVRVSSLLNRPARLLDGQGYGYVEDLLVANGKVTATILRPDLRYGTGLSATPYYAYDYGYSTGHDVYYVPYDRSQLSSIEGFDASRIQGPTPKTEATQ